MIGMLRRKPSAIGKKSLCQRTGTVEAVLVMRACFAHAPEQVEEAETLDAHAYDRPPQQHQADPTQDAGGPCAIVGVVGAQRAAT